MYGIVRVEEQSDLNEFAANSRFYGLDNLTT